MSLHVNSSIEINSPIVITLSQNRSVGTNPCRVCISVLCMKYCFIINLGTEEVSDRVRELYGV